MPAYWPGCDKAFVAKPTLIPNIHVQYHAADPLGGKPLSPDFPSNDAMYMMQASIHADQAAGLGFGLDANNPGLGFRVIIDPAQGPKGLALLTRANGTVLTDRWCDLSSGNTHHIRLVVLGQMVSIYVDNALVIDHLLDDLVPGQIAMVAQDHADFSALDYRSGIPAPF